MIFSNDGFSSVDYYGYAAKYTTVMLWGNKHHLLAWKRVHMYGPGDSIVYPSKVPLFSWLVGE